MAWSPEFLLTLASGAVAMAAAAGLLAAGFRDRAHRWLALAFVLAGGTDLSFAMAGMAGDAATADFWRRVLPYCFLPAGLVFLAFGAVYPRGRGPRAGLLLGGLCLAAAVAVDVAYLWDHALYRDFSEPVAANRGLPFAPGPLAAAGRLASLGPVVVALALARDLARPGPGPQRGPLLLSTGILLASLHSAVAGLLTRGLLGPSAGLPPWMQAADDLQLALMTALVLAVLATLARARRAPGVPPAVRSGAGHALAVTLLPLATGLTTLAALPGETEFRALRTTFDGFWGIVVPALALFALAGHRLRELPAARVAAVRNGTVAAGLMAFFLLGAEASRPALGGGTSALLGLAQTGALAAVVVWVHRLSRAVPHGGGAHGVDRLGPYRAALQAEIEAGAGPEQARGKLTRLRGELAITDTEHAVMDYTLRSAGAGLKPPAALAPGDVFAGRYAVLRALGEGGAGRTYLCRDERARREVVLKRIRAEHASPEGVAQVVREARAMAAVKHPNVVVLHDIEQVGSEAFIVMEHLEGGSLAQRLARGPLAPGEFRTVARGLLAALQAVHEAGAVHRDVKPSNVLLTPRGEAKLADFGVAHIGGFETTAIGLRDDGGAVGTVRYMSPEQALDHEVGPRSDLFSAAATLYEAHAGQAYLGPRPGESAVELLMRAAAPGPFDRSVSPPALRAWFARALAPAPEDRFPSARAMAAALDQALAAPGGA